jgi:hypothetical protein
VKISLPNHEWHLSYCLNVHPGNSWDEHFTAIKTFAPKIRDRLLLGKASFGLGLRLSAQAATTLLEQPEEVQALRNFLAAENFYPFTINVFPYGEFHHGAIKQKVYLPDWSDASRLRYTLAAARILAAIMPPELPYGSLSSLPIGYRAAVKNSCLPLIFDHLAELIRELAKLEQESGRWIRVGLEPEPDCLLDSTDSVCNFFHEQLRKNIDSPLDLQNRYLGVCLDTCHLAVLGESPAESLRKLRQYEIPVAKVQLSAAPVFSPAQLSAAAAFVDPVYLHQSTVRSNEEGALLRFADLPEALAFAKTHSCHELRTHFHIPLSCPESETMSSTRADLDSHFVRELVLSDVHHLEVETYTYAVLPEHLRRQPLEESIAAEIAWARQFLGEGL